MDSTDTTRLTITWSKETDLALRTFLGAHGMKKGDLSKFIEDAVRAHIFERTVQTIQDRNAGTDPEELQALIDEAVRETRKERWETRQRAQAAKP